MAYIFTRKSEVEFCAKEGVVYYKIQKIFTDNIGKVKLSEISRAKVVSSGGDEKIVRVALFLHGGAPKIFLTLSGDNVSDWDGLSSKINQWLNNGSPIIN